MDSKTIMHACLSLNFLYLAPRLQDFWAQHRPVPFILCTIGAVAIFMQQRSLWRK